MKEQNIKSQLPMLVQNQTKFCGKKLTNHSPISKMTPQYEETPRLKSLLADLSMSNELLREKIHHIEAGGGLWPGGGRTHEPRYFALPSNGGTAWHA